MLVTTTMSINKILITTNLITYFVGVAVTQTLYEGSPCLRHDNVPGVCKAAEKCEWIKKNNIQPSVLSRCSFDHDIIFICCGDERPNVTLGNVDCEKFVFDQGIKNWCGTINKGEMTTKLSNEEETTTAKVNEVKKDVGKKARRECEKLIETKTPLLTYNIFDGDVVPPGDYPHMAAIGYASEEVQNEYNFLCGGFLISPLFVLTAAHCFAPGMARPLIVRMGTVDLQQPDNPNNGFVQDIPIAQTIRHPEYLSSQRFNDIALLKLGRPTDISDSYVFPVCLNTNPNIPGPSADVDVIGFGATEDVQDKSQTLLKANLTIFDQDLCRQKYDSLRGGLADSQLCAWDPNFKKDACKGDSGGPLHYSINKVDYVVGIVSFGVGCASKDPAIYTRVSYYIDWIESIVWPN